MTRLDPVLVCLVGLQQPTLIEVALVTLMSQREATYLQQDDMGALTLSVVQTDYDIILTCRGLAQYNVLRFHMKYVLFSHIYTRMQKKNFKIKIVIIWVGFFF